MIQQRLTTTLNLLRAAGACTARYEHLVRAFGGTSFDHDAPINLLTILELNGADDCVWSLGATAENCDVVARLMAADFAEAVLPLYEKLYPGDMRPRAAIEAARAYARGEINDAALAVARDDAYDASRDVARDTSYAATYDAYDVACASSRAATYDAYDVAYAASRAATHAATYDAATYDAYDASSRAAYDAAHADIVRRYLLPDMESKTGWTLQAAAEEIRIAVPYLIPVIATGEPEDASGTIRLMDGKHRHAATVALAGGVAMSVEPRYAGTQVLCGSVARRDIKAVLGM